MSNYTVLHLHTDYSNCTTNIDSTTKTEMYVEKAKSLGMTAMAVSEHGNIFNWLEKKTQMEKPDENGKTLKYIHAVEAYITESLEEKVRDNRHCLMIAKNYDGVLEINRMMSKANNRNDGHFYYVPRITLEELFATSENIVLTSACLGGVLNSKSDTFNQSVLEFFSQHKNRCYLEVQHHDVDDQITYNERLLELSKEYGIPLVAGTDTHSLNEEMAKARIVLQKAKGVKFSNEENWDLTFKSYDELVNCFKKQNSLPMEDVYEAIENTNKIAEQVEPFEIDTTPKYPKLYDNSVEKFKEIVYSSIDTHPYALKNHSREEIEKRIEEELPVYIQTNTIDFMLLQKTVRDWEHENGIYTGYGRGSVSGSFIAYLLQITDMDSIKFDLNFFRFLNPSRVTNCDIDSDYFDEDRVKTIQFLLENPKIRSAKIITFQTIASKGSIREIGRALGMENDVVNNISKTIEANEDSLRKKYPELFYYADLVNGTIINSGTHAAGVLCSSLPIEEVVGICSSKDTPYDVSCLDMYGIDAYSMTKFDCLGLDNVGVINKTCELAGIDRITPDNIDLEDEKVWKSIQEDNCMIFQWESPFAGQILKSLFSEYTISKAREELPNISLLKLFSFGNGLIRPGCSSFRDSASKGIFYDNGLPELNNLLANEFGYISMQETIMKFLVQFCGYSDAESDTVRRAIAKKKGTEKLLPEIKDRFITHTSEKYNLSDEKCEEIIEPFLVSILNASDYGFSWNHSDAYSAIGYACGYLRYYYPLEFVSSCFNVFQNKEEKTANIINYCKRHKIKIREPRFRYAKSGYFFDKKENSIYKGMKSIKYLSEECADDLYSLRDNTYENFTDVLMDIKNLRVNSKQLDILTKLDFFSEFGNAKELLRIIDWFNFFKQGDAKTIKKEKINEEFSLSLMNKYAKDTNAKGQPLKSCTIIDCQAILHEGEEKIKSFHLEDMDVLSKIRVQKEYLGYVSATEKEEDRAKLLVEEVYPLKRKKDGKQFGYSVICNSIGSGKKTRFTVFSKDFNRCGEITKGDIVLCIGWKRDGEYFSMNEYKKIY